MAAWAFLKALEKDRDLRYQNGAEIRADLRRLKRDTDAVRSGAAASLPAPGAGRARLGGKTLIAAAAVLLLAGAAFLLVRPMRSGAPPGAPRVQTSVAVLPFENVGTVGELDYLRLALADEVATALSYAPSLAVRPLASSRRFAGPGVSPQEAGRELRASGIVTGHFSMQGTELRVTVEAVEVESDRLLWRTTIAAPAADAMALRETLTGRIREGLLPALGTKAGAAGRDRPRNADAYALYLQSVGISNDPAPNREAIAMLERAVSLDAEYANAWAALSGRYYFDAEYGGGGPEALRRSEAALRQALALDPNRIDAAVSMINLQVDAGRLRDAYDSASRLVAERPDSGEAHFGLSYVLRYGGLLEEAAYACERALALDPDNARFRSCALAFSVLGRYDRALDFARLDAGSQWAAIITRQVYQRMGRRREAQEQHARWGPGMLPDTAPAIFGRLLARCLDEAPPEAQEPGDEDLTALLRVWEDPEPLYSWATDLSYCGHGAAALRLLREAVRRNYCAYPAVEIDAALAAVRASPGYGELAADARACRARFEEHVKGAASLP